MLIMFNSVNSTYKNILYIFLLYIFFIQPRPRREMMKMA